MTPTARESLARDLAALCQHLHARGWVANHDGNVSARLPGPSGSTETSRFLASPTAVSKGDVTSEMLVEVAPDADGGSGFRVVAGDRKVFSEFALHMQAYRTRPDVNWVCHAHPPYATAWAVAGRTFWDLPFMGEPVVSLGAEIPVVDASGLADALSRCDAVLLRNHGVITVGPCRETAQLRMELVEHVARIAALAEPLGGTRPLAADEVERLLAARAKAGLGPSRRTHASGADTASGFTVAAGKPDVGSLVAEALRRF